MYMHVCYAYDGGDEREEKSTWEIWIKKGRSDMYTHVV
jgi:hypothetical protein